MTIFGIMTSITGKNVSGNTNVLTVQSYPNEQDNCKARSERAASLALPNNSLIDLYDKHQEQCHSVTLLPVNASSIVLRRHSSHTCPVDKQETPTTTYPIAPVEIKLQTTEEEPPLNPLPPPPPVPKRTFRGKTFWNANTIQNQQKLIMNKLEDLRKSPLTRIKNQCFDAFSGNSSNNSSPLNGTTKTHPTVIELAKQYFVDSLSDQNSDDDRMSLDNNSVFDESTPPSSARLLQAISNRRTQRIPSDSNRSQTTTDTGYISNGSDSKNSSDFRSRFSSVDTQCSLDINDSPLPKDSPFKLTDYLNSPLNKYPANRKQISIPQRSTVPAQPQPASATTTTLAQPLNNQIANGTVVSKNNNNNNNNSKWNMLYNLNNNNKKAEIVVNDTKMKQQKRQDSNLSNDSYSITSSPGYNSKSMEAPLLQYAAKINKNKLHHQNSTDSFIMMTTRYSCEPIQSGRQDSSLSSDSFSQISSPSCNSSKTLESSLLPSMKRFCNGITKPVPTGVAKPMNGLIVENDQSTPTSPITKSVSTPTSLQTIVRFQNGQPSLQHTIIKRRKSSNYVNNAKFKFRIFQIFINALALLAIAGGLAAYFNAYPKIKVINKTVITPVKEVSTIGINPAPGICLPIIIKFCQGPQIPYNFTVFPNYIGHFGQLETQVDLDAYDALVDVRCYQLVSLFLCSLFVPKCGPAGTPVPPCATLCNETMHRCGFFFDVFGLSLPDYLNCKLFKDFDDPDECIGMQQVHNVNIEQRNPKCDGFKCDTTRCIPLNYVCDGHLDCMDQSDEFNCQPCDNKSVYCGDGKCMNSKQVCDGIPDCPYGQDERNCIRLSDRNGDMGKGVLEVFKPKEQEWSPACVKNWDRSVSPTAVCSMLGYSSVNATAVVTRNTRRTLLASVNVSTDIWRMYSKKRSNLMREFSSCKQKEDYPIAELTCTNFGCGRVKRRRKPQKRIIGGAKASPGDWPFLAAILGGPDKIFYCAGVLISDQWVLTASHCIGNHSLRKIDDWHIQLGITRRDSYSYTTQVFKVKAVVSHPQYNTIIPHDNDIALFQLETRVAFHEHLLPVCLPPTGMKELRAGQLCTVIGWGKSSEKNPKSTYEPIVNEVEVPIVRRGQCDQWLENLTVSDGMVCAGYEDGGKDACQGDSGGPLLCRYPGERDKWYVGGIVSWGIMCAHPKLPGVYANVIKYLPWILDEIANRTDVNSVENGEYNGY